MDGAGGYNEHAAGSGDCSIRDQEHFHPLPNKAGFFGSDVTHPVSCEVKPRLTKEQHDILEAQYQKQNKPNTNTKRGFAESLNVSLDKVNNWFQNRRAKSKQDVKKQAGANAMNLFAAQQHAGQLSYGSDSEVSPAFSAAPDYFSMMQQCPPDEHLSNGLGSSETSSLQEHGQFSGLQFMHAMSGDDQYPVFDLRCQPQTDMTDMFDSPQEINRRTLTQEQFDAIAAQEHDSTPDSSNFDAFQSGFPQSSHVMDDYFGGMHSGGVKREDAFSFPHELGLPPSSFDSTVPSSVSEQSMSAFPSSSNPREHESVSAGSSEWTESRSSSVFESRHEDAYPSASVSYQQAAATAAQWQPGQSVPVDFNAQMQEFRQVAQIRQAPQLQLTHEQPLAFPSDEAFARRDSTAQLAHSLSNVGLQSAHADKFEDFASPAPATTIAARRQRPRPAALGQAALRSQSYGGAVQSASFAPTQQQVLTPGSQPLRRIRSTNVVNGVAQGRIAKAVSGTAQKSPLSWTFADAANSPKSLRQLSLHSPNGALAPPTPMSPREFPRNEPPRQQLSQWHASSGLASQQPSISESDEQTTFLAPAAPATYAPNFSSPPHSPSYVQQTFVQRRVGSRVITENTPPQSAPASQSCFSINPMAVAQPHTPIHSHFQSKPAHLIPPFLPSQHHQYMSVMASDAQLHMPTASFAQSQDFVVPAVVSMSSDMPMHFVNGHGELVLGFPQTYQPLQQQQQQLSQTPTPPQGQYSMFSTAEGNPSAPGSTQMFQPQGPAQTSEFFVHEYSPPRDLNQMAAPRRAVDAGPKAYTFANQGPEHFEKGEKGKKGGDVKAYKSSSISANSIGVALTS